MNSYVHLKLALNAEVAGGITTKIIFELREQINQGVLKPGDMLPPSRSLAKELAVSRGTVVAAYEELVAEGYLMAQQGLGTMVTPNLEEFYPSFKKKRDALASWRLSKRADPPQSKKAQELLTDITGRADWKRAWRVAALAQETTLQLPAAGLPDLLVEIAEYLRLMRATLRNPDQILVTAGARDGLDLLLTSLGTTRGRRLRIGVEQNATDTLRDIALLHGADIVDLPIDEEGVVVDDIPDSFLDAVIITPSSQLPSGAPMSLTRRHQLIAWGRRNGALIIEDDFDAELKSKGSPPSTLASLDDPADGIVATLASFSSTMSLTLAAGFLVIPESHRESILRVRESLGPAVAPILQVALTELLASGELHKHVKRLKKRVINSGDKAHSVA